MMAKKNVKKILEALHTKTDLWYILRNAPDPWKTHALRRLIRHKDLEADEAWSLLELTQDQKQIRELLSFLWQADKKIVFEGTRCHGSLEVRDLAWEFIEINIKHVRRATVAECLADSIRDDVPHRKQAWKIFQGLGLMETDSHRILTLPNCSEFREIKSKAVELLSKSKKEHPSKIALAIVARANKREA
jgi:hypothetical protein